MVVYINLAVRLNTYTVSSSSREEFTRLNTAFQNSITQASVLGRYDGVFSSMECAAKCVPRKSCFSFFYNSEKQTCQTHCRVFATTDSSFVRSSGEEYHYIVHSAYLLLHDRSIWLKKGIKHLTFMSENTCHFSFWEGWEPEGGGDRSIIFLKSVLPLLKKFNVIRPFEILCNYFAFWKTIRENRCMLFLFMTKAHSVKVLNMKQPLQIYVRQQIPVTTYILEL